MHIKMLIKELTGKLLEIGEKLSVSLRHSEGLIATICFYIFSSSKRML